MVNVNNSINIILVILLSHVSVIAQEADLSRGFANPGNAARPKACWNWLNGDVRPEILTRDLENRIN